ncbi:response regulator [Paenibacillus sp. BAC0078]
MYRLLIADDEPLEREGLECIVERSMPGIFHIIHASNGRMAIEFAEEHRPHIAIMDINMPGIGGLEALREMKRRLPNTKFIVLTAYDYFTYAQEALSLGAKEYFLKPAKREQLIEVFQRLLNEIEQENHLRMQELEMRHKVSQLLPLAENELALMLMLDQTVDTNADQLSEWLDIPLTRGCAIVAAFHGEAYMQKKNKIYDYLRSFVKSHSPDSIVSSLINQHMVIFLHKPTSVSETNWYQKTKQLAEQLYGIIEQHLGLKVSIGIGSTHSRTEGFRKSYFEAVFASTMLNKLDKACHFDDLKQRDSQPYSFGTDDIVNNQTQQSYVTFALQRMREQRVEQTLTVLDRARQYISEKLSDELSLEVVADFVHLNPHYFSKIFKQQCGESFIDYVTRLRIEKAISLIKAGQLSLKEISFEVGYKDPNYFSRVFKKITGLAPTSYKDQK